MPSSSTLLLLILRRIIYLPAAAGLCSSPITAPAMGISGRNITTTSGPTARPISSVHQGRNINSGSELKRLIAVGLALFCGAAGAAPSADPYFGMIIGEEWTELDRAVHERLAADPLDG